VSASSSHHLASRAPALAAVAWHAASQHLLQISSTKGCFACIIHKSRFAFIFVQKLLCIRSKQYVAITSKSRDLGGMLRSLTKVTRRV
jgi:hypothetical protein